MKKKSLADAVFEQLRDHIVSGKLEPGEPLPAERELAEILQVNRGAVREALKRLDQERLVSIQHGESTRVEDFRETAGMGLLGQLLFASDGTINAKTAKSIIEIRSALAPEIARRCAERSEPDVHQRLRAIVQQMEINAGLSDRQRLAIDFWRVLVEGTDNIAYRLALNTLNETYGKLLDVLASALREELNDLPSYQGIAEAVLKRNADGAERHTRVLIQKGADGLLNVVSAIKAKNRSR